MKKCLLSMLSANGKISSKRLITLLAFLMMSIGFISNLYWDQTIDKSLFDSMQWVVMVGLGVTASEAFSPKSKADAGIVDGNTTTDVDITIK